MESTPATPHLLTDVRFGVARKGYDPDEVDNFLEKVSDAVAQLQDKLRQATAEREAADARAANVNRIEARLQARIAELEADLAAARAGAPAAAATIAAVSRDAEAEAEAASSVLVMAQRTADSTVNEARAKAAALLTDAEAEAVRILGSARAQAEESLGDLERTRSEMLAENEALDSFLLEQRAVLAAGLARIQAVLDDPRALRVGAPPVAAAPVVEPAAAPAIEDVVELDEVIVDPTPTPVPPVSPVTVSTPERTSLFDDEPVGPPTELVTVFDLTEDDEFLAEDDDDADDAMRRFFDADFGDEPRFER